MSSGLEDFSLFDLFRMEAEEQVRVLQSGLLELERGQATPAILESLMRAAHSIKGAARIVGLDPLVSLMHGVEDRFVAAQAGDSLRPGELDRLLTATDWLARLQSVPESEISAWFAQHTVEIQAFAASFASEPQPAMPVAAALDTAPPAPAPLPAPAAAAEEDIQRQDEEQDIFAQLEPGQTADQARHRQRHVRIAAERFDQILALASETLVASRSLCSQAAALERTARALGRAAQLVDDPEVSAALRASALLDLERLAAELTAGVGDLDLLVRTNERTSENLYRGVLAGRLRPFAEAVTSAPRLVRDTARDLGKQVRLEIVGDQTRVDRDILERLEAPISHLLTNAIDHGIETPDERRAHGKAAEARLTIQARHERGRLLIVVRDDGRGVSPDQLRERVVERGLAAAKVAAGFSDAELLEFLFLPGFSTRDTVNAVSGRGVGLNVVQSMVQEAGGAVEVESKPGLGTTFRLTLPVTRSVVKVIRVEVEGELYAVPLVRIDRVGQLETQQQQDGPLRIVQLASLLGMSARAPEPGSVPVLICGAVAFVVDRLIDQVELSVRQLDARLGKIPGVSAASLDESGQPLLILDVDDLIATALGHTAEVAADDASSVAPHILVVDDSHTVREIVRRLLAREGYRVTAAQNGQEAWNLLRLNDYDLLVSDVDMPQMNGIELVSKVRENARLARLPVIILSYKAQEEDRRRGLEAGADFYLTKGDFQNENFRQAILDLVGPAVL